MSNTHQLQPQINPLEEINESKLTWTPPQFITQLTNNPELTGKIDRVTEFMTTISYRSYGPS